MRYYELTVTNASGQVYQPSATGQGFQLASSGPSFSSLANGATNPGALNIEFDVKVVPMHTPQGQSLISVWGVGLAMIGQAANLNGASFTLKAGMAKGLPLANLTANPVQSGLIMYGNVFQAFGNWQGVNQTLDLLCIPGQLTPPNGIAFTWSVGQTVGQAVTQSLQQAFSGYSVVDNTTPLMAPRASSQTGHYTTLDGFAEALNDLTQPYGAKVTGNPNYPGVGIALSGTVFTLYDGTIAANPIQLAFEDLIGQPTWIGPAQIQFKTVLRSDIAIGDNVKFPTVIAPPYALTTANAAAPNAPSRSKSVFQGTFLITEVHHFANFRVPDADAWNTTYVGVPVAQ